MTFYPQTGYYYYDQPAVGIKNRVSEKIRVAEEVLPTGDTLSAYRSIQQIYPQSESYTRDVNYVEVAFSPQNEINDDINSSMGYFNIGDYIGDPAQFAQSGSSYPPLDKLRDTYFEKYYKNYNWTDYIRLIRYFDNSLFKMIKDFIPARTSLASGVVIKQHLLERNKVTPPQVETSQHVYSGSIESGFISGGDGGSMPPQNNFPTSKVSSYLNVLTLTTLDGGLLGVYSTPQGIFEPVNYLSDLFFSVKDEVFNKFSSIITPNIYLNYDGGVSDQVTASLYSVQKGVTPSSLDDYTLESQLSSSIANGPSLLGKHIPTNIILPSIILQKNKVYVTLLQSGSSGFKVTGSLGVYYTNNQVNIGSLTYENVSTTPADRGDITQYYSLNTSPTPDLLQIYNETIDTPVGPQIITNSDENEFYNGEFSGSEVLVTNGDLNSTRVIETADLNSGFIASYDDVLIETTTSFPVGDGTFNIQKDPSSPNYTRGIVVAPVDSNGIDRTDYWSSLISGNVIQIKQIGGSGNGQIINLTVTGVPFLVFDKWIITTIPKIYNGAWYQATGVQSWIVEVINDPSIINIQASILGDEPLLNNVPNNRLSDIYQDVDYADGSAIPVNFDLILNGQALKFPIPDSNYSQKSWSNGRYNGSRVSSPTFNR